MDLNQSVNDSRAVDTSQSSFRFSFCVWDVQQQPCLLQARIRIGGLITIKGLPEPTIKVSQSLPFRVVGLQAHLRYEVPIPALMESMDALYKPPARMLLRYSFQNATICLASIIL